MPPVLPPYAMVVPTFRFRHLATLAGRAPIGGAREVALACFVIARLAADCANATLADGASRLTRSAGAKAWLGTLSLPAPVRTPMIRCAELAAAAPAPAVAGELARLSLAAAAYLDGPSRTELDALVASLQG